MSLDGLEVLITAGPTIEYWDKVRYLTNGSSGEIGKKIAESFKKKKADVTLVSSLEEHSNLGVNHIQITSARDMYKSVKKEFKKCKIFISAAAVADFRPVCRDGKIQKRDGVPTIKLKKNPDILKWAGENKDGRLIVGFSLSEKIDIKKARLKQKEKKCDIMISNGVKNIAANKRAFAVITGEKTENYKNKDVKETAEIIVKECVKNLKNF